MALKGVVSAFCPATPLLFVEEPKPSLESRGKCSLCSHWKIIKRVLFVFTEQMQDKEHSIRYWNVILKHMFPKLWKRSG